MLLENYGWLTLYFVKYSSKKNTIYLKLVHKLFKRSGQSRSSWNKLALPYGNKRLLDLDRFWFIQRGISWAFSNKV